MFAEETSSDAHTEQEEKGVPKSKAWADEDDEQEQEEEEFAPPPDVTYDKNKTTKTVTTYKKNEKGQVVKVIARYKITTTKVLKSADIDKRKQWKKFGMCTGLPPGLEKGITEVSPDDFELVLGVDTKKPEVKEEGKSVFANIECRYCKKKGEHYTTNCPLKEMLRGKEDEQQKEDQPATGAKGEVYRPPNRRGGAAGESTESSRDELPTVRVSNLSESAFENDLQELFKPFGAVQRVFIAKDKLTGASRGFGFVTFYHREDAQRAINKLDGHGYDHLILHLEWALPSKK